jgi:hypothetical protein
MTDTPEAAALTKRQQRAVVQLLNDLIAWRDTLDPNLRRWVRRGRLNGPRPMPVGAIKGQPRRRRP